MFLRQKNYLLLHYNTSCDICKVLTQDIVSNVAKKAHFFNILRSIAISSLLFRQLSVANFQKVWYDQEQMGQEDWRESLRNIPFRLTIHA